MLDRQRIKEIIVAMKYLVKMNPKKYYLDKIDNMVVLYERKIVNNCEYAHIDWIKLQEIELYTKLGNNIFPL